jgi:glycosyltransferase involved in cell wall biosynthesis
VTTTPSVSVIIPTYKREGVLCQTLQAILQQTYPKFEIIVVDQTQMHLPETEACLQDLAAKGAIRYYRHQPPSLPEARNFGVRQARGEIVLFLDDDILPDSGLIAAQVAEYADPTVGGVGGRHSDPAHDRDGEYPVRSGYVRQDGVAVASFFSTLRQESVEWSAGGDSSFRKQLIEQAGLFEPCFVGTSAYEEIDFCFRLRRRGYRIVFTPASHMLHLQEKSGGCGNRRQDEYAYYYSLIHNALLFAFRNMKPANWPRIFGHWLITNLALAKQQRSLRFAFLFPVAISRAVVSYFRSLQSLRGSDHAPYASEDGS